MPYLILPPSTLDVKACSSHRLEAIGIPTVTTAIYQGNMMPFGTDSIHHLVIFITGTWQQREVLLIIERGPRNVEPTFAGKTWHDMCMQ